MLSLLHIENIAVIEQADISFDGGFNVLTGETGAGKSIVIDAISAILGERAYRDMIRTGTQKASVRAVFTQVPQYPWFQENGVDYDPETVIQREIHLDGKNVCRVNGCLVSVSILRKLGIQLINIHGQHDSASLFDEENHLIYLDEFADNGQLRQAYSEAYARKLGIQLINIHGQHDSASLFDEENHLIYLDEFADNGQLRQAYSEAYAAVARLRREIDSLTMDESEKLRRMETLRYQIEEIEKAELEPGEDDALEARRKLLQNAEKLSNGMDEAVECLYGGYDSDGAAGLLAQAEHALARLGRFTDSFETMHQRISDLMYQVQDAAEEVRDARDDLNYSADELERIEERLDQRISDLMYQVQDAAEEVRDARDDLNYSADELERIEERLDTIHKLRRKYGVTCEDILAYLDKAKKELDEIEFADDHLERLKGKLKKAEDAAWNAALALRENRKQAALDKAKKELDEIEFADDHLERLKGKLKKAEDAAWNAALALRENRKQAAQALSQRILSELTQLDMPRVRFACQFRELELTSSGADGVAFYMSANAGEDLKADFVGADPAGYAPGALCVPVPGAGADIQRRRRRGLLYVGQRR